MITSNDHVVCGADVQRCISELESTNEKMSFEFLELDDLRQLAQQLSLIRADWAGLTCMRADKAAGMRSLGHVNFAGTEYTVLDGPLPVRALLTEKQLDELAAERRAREIEIMKSRGDL